MPVIELVEYNPPFLFRNSHIHTIAPAIFRKVTLPVCTTKLIDTSDGDFIEIDYYSNKGKIVAILTHGIEGNSRKPYILGMTKALLEAGIDVIAVNLRGCSGMDNNLLSSYHAGKTDDLDTIVNYALKILGYQQIVLIGFSLGANITLKYAGERGRLISSSIKATVGISVPCDLSSTSKQMSLKSNRLYLNRFLGSLKLKAICKVKTFRVSDISESKILSAKNFNDFDEIFTAPVHGFKSAQEYWNICSSKPYIANISIPSYILNALDDPMLSSQCYPFDECSNNPFVFLETPKYGGHVGFAQNLTMNKIFYHELQVIKFLNKNLLNQ
jgi:uncharacterized protein